MEQKWNINNGKIMDLKNGKKMEKKPGFFFIGIEKVAAEACTKCQVSRAEEHDNRVVFVSTRMNTVDELVNSGESTSHLDITKDEITFSKSWLHQFKK